VARRDGILSLESHLSEGGHDEFLERGLHMAIDGQDPTIIEAAMEKEIETVMERHAAGKALFDNIGKYAPAFGMIGTLIGLVQMLSELDDPSKIGIGMANALLTTFYGALLANLVFIPLAGKLGIRSEDESTLRQMTVEGLLSMARGESPTVVRTTMQTFLSEKNREEYRPRI
jgi:chemotaxis protein MotA